MSNRVTAKMLENKTKHISKYIGATLTVDTYYCNVHELKEDGNLGFRFASAKNKRELMLQLEAISTTLFFLNGKSWSKKK